MVSKLEDWQQQYREMFHIDPGEVGMCHEMFLRLNFENYDKNLSNIEWSANHFLFATAANLHVLLATSEQGHGIITNRQLADSE